MDFPGPAGAGHSGKTEADVGDELVIIIDVEINALEVEVSVMAIKQSDGLRKDRSQRYPVVTQHKGPGDIRVKVAQGIRPRRAAGRARDTLAAVCHALRYENAVISPDRKHICEMLRLRSCVDSGMRHCLVEGG